MALDVSHSVILNRSTFGSAQSASLFLSHPGLYCHDVCMMTRNNYFPRVIKRERTRALIFVPGLDAASVYVKSTIPLQKAKSNDMAKAYT